MSPERPPTATREDLARCLTLVLAGGQGERLYPLTRDRAKPAVPFGAAYRIIDFTLSNCLNSGLRRIYVLTQYKSMSLERHLRHGWQLLHEQLDEFVVPIPPQQRMGGSWYLGTADAIYQNIYTLEQVRPLHVLVLSGDHIYRMDYSRMLAYHLEKKADLTVACIEVPRDEARHFGVAGVDGDGRIRQWQEKPAEPESLPGREDRCLASMGIYIFGTKALVRRISQDARRDSAHDFGRDIIPAMLEEDRVYAYPYALREGDRPYWRDIGRVDAYYEANLDLVSPHPEFQLHYERWPIWTAPHHQPPVRTARRGASPGEVLDCLLAPGASVAGGHVERSLLGYGVRVEADARVEGAILMDGVVVEEGARIRRAILDKRVRVPAGTEIGFDPEQDAARFTVTDAGVVVVPKDRAF